MEEEEEVVEVEAEVVVERARKQSIRQLLPPLKTPPSKPFQRFFLRYRTYGTETARTSSETISNVSSVISFSVSSRL